MSEVCAEKLAPVSTSMTSAEAMSGYRGAPRLSFANGSGKLSVRLPFEARFPPECKPGAHPLANGRVNAFSRSMRGAVNENSAALSEKLLAGHARVGVAGRRALLIRSVERASRIQQKRLPSGFAVNQRSRGNL